MSSGVFERLRKTSGLKWLDEAEQLRKEVLIFATSKAIPKSWRFTFSAPMADSARKMVDYLVTAKEFYPNTEHNVEMRRHYMTLAVAQCKHILQDLQLVEDICSQTKADWYEGITARLDDEIKLIKGARNNTRLINAKRE